VVAAADGEPSNTVTGFHPEAPETFAANTVELVRDAALRLRRVNASLQQARPRQRQSPARLFASVVPRRIDRAATSTDGADSFQGDASTHAEWGLQRHV
jgi:hypothetical protein